MDIIVFHNNGCVVCVPLESKSLRGGAVWLTFLYLTKLYDTERYQV